MNKKGFSLIEVLIAIVILAVGLLGVGAMQTSSVKTNFFSRYMTQACYAAQGGLESLDNSTFDSLKLQAGSHNEPSVTVSGIILNRSYSVADDPSLGKVITYTIRWNDGVDRTIAFSTIRSHK